MSFVTSSIDYLEQVQAQSTKETWANQIGYGSHIGRHLGLPK